MNINLIDKEIYLVNKQDDVYKDIERLFNVSFDKAYSKKTELNKLKKEACNSFNQ